MNASDEPFGARLYAALRQEPSCHRWLNGWHYDAIQQLKQANREATVKLFYGSRYDVIQQLKTQEPREIARYLAEQAEQDAAGAAIVLMMG